MKEKSKKEKALRYSQIIRSLIMVYGPIADEDLAEKMLHYFPEDFADLDYDDVLDMIDELVKMEGLMLNKDDEISFYTAEECETVLSLPGIGMYYDSLMEKEFADPQQILDYEDIFNIRNNKAFDELKEYYYSLKFKKGADADDLFRQMILVIFKLYDSEEYLSILNKAVKSGDLNKLSELMDVLVGVVPRGFFHGYSFVEISELLQQGIGPYGSFDADRLTDVENSRKYGSYTYEECLKLSEQLKETDIFEDFCSDNVIELLINYERIYVQLLGYYRGDRDIIIYGNRDQFEYNYQVFADLNGPYPDKYSRIEVLEVNLDDSESFLNDDVLDALEDRNIQKKLPLIARFDSNKGPQFPTDADCDLTGAVLEQLLMIEDLLKEDVGERCEEHNIFKIIQFYLYEDGLQSGEYMDPELSDASLPFEPEPVVRTIKAEKKADLGIGIYVISIYECEERVYMAVMMDKELGIVVDHLLVPEHEMAGAAAHFVEFLEEKSIRPDHLSFNNDFAMKAMLPLIEVYDIIDRVTVGDEDLDDLYMEFTEYEGLDDDEAVLH